MIATAHAAAFTPGGTCRARLEGLRLLPLRQQVLLAADWAALVLPVWEKAYPGDNRSRRAIEAARKGDGKAAANAAYAAANAAYAAANAAYAAYAAANAAYAAANAAYAAYGAAYAAALVADWSAVRRLWESAYHGGQVWRPAWATPLARELARDPQTYQILLDMLEDQGVPVDGLRGGEWSLSNWAVYHLTEDKP